MPITAPGVVAPRAISATPFLPQGGPPAQRPLAGGSAAPARPASAAPIAPAPRGPDGHAPSSARPSPRAHAVVVDESRDARTGPSFDADPRDATRGGVNRPAVPGERGRGGPPSIDPSLSLPIAARRPWALILVVLLIDLGLAAAGVWMLTQGLSDRPGRPAPPRSGAADPRGTPPSPLARPS